MAELRMVDVRAEMPGRGAGPPQAHRPLEPSTFFPDGRSSRAPIADTVARGQLRLDRALYEGRDAKGEYVTEGFSMGWLGSRLGRIS